jgi:adenosylcobinamide-GDP ribazoletransferase
VALQFLTRLPLPRDLDPEPADLVRAGPWFPAVGAVIGGLLALLAQLGLAAHLAPGAVAALVMTGAVLLTGAFHEDGLADTADGIGGGMNREDRLRIMRDSRIGSYGAVALILLFGLRAALLWSTRPEAWALALVTSHTLARWSTLVLLTTGVYAREQDAGPGKPLVGGLSQRAFATATFATLAGIALLSPGPGLAGLLGSGALALALGRYFQRRIGGLTGDCLGAANVACEVFTLLCFAAAQPALRSPWIGW